MRALPLILVLLVSPAWAATYYVATDGEDGGAGDGGASTEWLTPNYGVTNGAGLQPGDTLIIRDGLYEQLAVTNLHGTAENHITIQAENDYRVIVSHATNFRMDEAYWTQVGPFTTHSNTTAAKQSLYSISITNTPDGDLDESDDKITWFGMLVQDQSEVFLPLGADVLYDDYAGYITLSVPTNEAAFNSSYPWLGSYDTNGSGEVTGYDTRYYSEDWFPEQGLQRTSTNSVDPNTGTNVGYKEFWYDPADSNLYIGVGTPYYKNWMIGTSYEKNFSVSGCSYIDVRGIHGRGPDRQPSRQNAVNNISISTNITLTNMKFSFGGFSTFGVYRAIDCTFNNVECTGGGITGAAMSLSTNTVWNNAWFHHNGWRGHSPWGVNGGVKCIPRNFNCTFNESLAEDNNGFGFWWDDSNGSCSTINCVGRRNAGAGLHVELTSYDILSDGDMYYNNTGRGIYVSRGNSNVTINAAVCINNDEGITVNQQEARGATNNNVIVRNSIVTHNRVMDMYICDVADYPDSNHSLNNNWYGPNFKVNRPYDKWFELQSTWQAQGYDLDSDFSNSVPYQMIRGELIAGWPLTPDIVAYRMWMGKL